MDKLTSLLLDVEENLMDEETLVDHYVRKEGLTPLDVLCERESRLDIINLLRDIDTILDSTDKKILQLYIIENKSMEEIGLRIGMTKMGVSKRFNNISTKFIKSGLQIPHFDNYMGKDFLIKQSNLEAGSPSGCGFPHELLRRVNIGGRWGTSRGRKMWVSRSKCILPESFRDSFKDDKTVCTLCKTCKREAR